MENVITRGKINFSNSYNVPNTRYILKSILYEKIELIKPEKENELIEDLKQRTGLPVHAVKINKIDFLRDVASVTIFYYYE